MHINIFFKNRTPSKKITILQPNFPFLEKRKKKMNLITEMCTRQEKKRWRKLFATNDTPAATMNCFGLRSSSFVLRLEGICLNDFLVKYVDCCVLPHICM